MIPAQLRRRIERSLGYDDHITNLFVDDILVKVIYRAGYLWLGV